MASPVETTSAMTATTHSRCESPMTSDDDSATSHMARDTQRITEVCQQFFLNEEMPAGHLWQWSVSELYGVMIGMFRRLGIFPDTMPVAEGALIAFLDDVCAGYLHNPYHSFAHGADVASVVYDFLHMPHAMTWLTPLDRVSMMISALCHDIGHPGLNNVYQVNANTQLAQRYNQESVLEHYSCDITAELLRKHDLLRWIPQSFAELETQEVSSNTKTTTTDSTTTTADDDDNGSKSLHTPADYIYKRINDTILYTDMKFHFELLDQLHHLVDELHGCDMCDSDDMEEEDESDEREDEVSSTAVEEEDEDEEDSMTSDNDDDNSSVNSEKLFGPNSLGSQLSRQSSGASESRNTVNNHVTTTTTTTTATTTATATSSNASSSTDILPTTRLSPAQRSTLCSILLHAADISNTARPWAVFKWWSHSINTEFRHQSKCEREEGLPLSPGLDRPADEEMTGNIEFAELVRPFFVGLSELIPEMRPFLQNLDANVQRLRMMESAKRNNTTKSSSGAAPVSPRRLGERRVSLAAGHLLVPADWQNRLIRRRNTLAHMVMRRNSLRRTLSRPSFMTSSRSSSVGGATSSDVIRNLDGDPPFILASNTTCGIPTTLRPSLVMRTNSEAELRAHRLRRATVPCSSAYTRTSAETFGYHDPQPEVLEHHDHERLSRSLLADLHSNTTTTTMTINHYATINENYVMASSRLSSDAINESSNTNNTVQQASSLVSTTLPLLSDNNNNNSTASNTRRHSHVPTNGSVSSTTTTTSSVRHSIQHPLPSSSSSLRESRRGSAVMPLGVFTSVDPTNDEHTSSTLAAANGGEHRHTKLLRIDTDIASPNRHHPSSDYEHLSSATPTSELFSPTSTDYFQGMEDDEDEDEEDEGEEHHERHSPSPQNGHLSPRDNLTNLCLRTLSRAARALSWLPLTANAQYRSSLSVSKPATPPTPATTATASPLPSPSSPVMVHHPHPRRASTNTATLKSSQ